MGPRVERKVEVPTVGARACQACGGAEDVLRLEAIVVQGRTGSPVDPVRLCGECIDALAEKRAWAASMG